MASFERVVLTGGAGLIGSHVVDLLVAGRDNGTYGEVVVFDNFTRGRMDNLSTAMGRGAVTIVEGDVRDASQVAAVIDGADLVFHLAAIRITHCAEDPRLAVDVLGNGTFNVLDACHRSGVRRVVASSSASVYGLADAFPTTESQHPYNNRTLYGALKVFNEGLLRSFHDMYGLDYVALRYFNVYGPRMDIHESPLIFGDGSQTMDFVYVTDIARANVLAAQANVSDEVFNIASATETSLLQLANALSEVMGSEVAPVHGPERAVNPVSRRLADVSKAQSLLGFIAEVDLSVGLRDLVAWWRSNTDAEGHDHL